MPNKSLRYALAVLILGLLPALLTGCAIMPGQSTSGDATWGVEPAPVQDRDSQSGATASGQSPEQSTGDLTGPLIIRTKMLRLQVKDTSESVTQVTSLAKAHSGVVTDLQVATDTDEWLYRYDKYGSPASDGAALRGWVTVRVPVGSFDAFIEDVSKLGTVKFESETSSDVTQEHVDLSARLANLRAQEARLRELVASAQNVTDVLAVEKELWRVRGEIESLDAQVQWLERQAAMATVTVELTEDRPVVRPGGQSWGFLEAITTGIRGAAQVFNFLISLLIASTPLVLVGILSYFLVRSIRRRRAGRASAAVTPQTTSGPAAPATETETATPTRPGATAESTQPSGQTDPPDA